MDMQEVFVDSSYPHTLRIPKEWAFTPINNAMDIVGGNQPPKSEFSNLSGEGLIRLIQIRDYKSDANKTYIPIEKAKRFVSKGDVMIGRYGPPIFQILRGLEGAYNVALMKAVPVAGAIDNEFLYFYLQNRDLYNYVEAASDRTAGQSGVNKAHLEKYPFSLPPLSEQKVIADKLDTLLAQVETTKARLERIPNILKTFRQSVLAAAVSGKLTEAKVGLIGKIKDCGSVVSGLAFKKSQYSENGSRLLQIANVGYGCTKWDNPNHIPIELSESCSEYSMRVGDIALALNRPITNDTLKVTRIQEKDLPATLYQRVARIRCHQSVLEPSYMFLIMQSPEFLKKVEINLKGSDQPYLNTTDLASFELYAPSLEEQPQIVRRVEKLFAFADNIEQKTNAALERVNNLTQSILAKAFRGELTADWRADNPELISGENSAEALLAKIKVEREANKSTSKGKRKLTRKAKPKKEIQSKILLENPVVGVLNKKGIAKPQAIFDELKELMDLREVLKEISQLLEQQVIKEIDKDGQQYLEINR